jgi:site-specific DNA-methyltransferase (adenine-specific)
MLKVNEIYLGDCREIIKSIDDNIVDLIILDPPYILTKEFWDKEDIISMDFINDLFRILKPTGNLYCWCGLGEKSQCLLRWFPIFNTKFYFKDMIIWQKQRGMGMRKGWLYTREELLWFVKDNKQFIWNKNYQYSEEKRTFTATYSDHIKMEKYRKSVKSDFKRITNIWTDIREPNISWNKKEIITNHFTPKPIKALERIIKLHTLENHIVLDPFLGSGQTIISCININRQYIGIEQNEDYYKYCLSRIQNYIMKI